jgi:hypothetical protein
MTAIEQHRAEMSEICARVGAELERISLALRVLEGHLTGAAASGWALDEARIQELQQVDSILQHAAALREFIGALRVLPSGEADLDRSLELVPLERMRARLAGHAPAAECISALEWL